MARLHKINKSGKYNVESTFPEFKCGECGALIEFVSDDEIGCYYAECDCGRSYYATISQIKVGLGSTEEEDDETSLNKYYNLLTDKCECGIAFSDIVKDFSSKNTCKCGKSYYKIGGNNNDIGEYRKNQLICK